ncbi:major facilitator superfamily domain-containing protein [Fusarium redolens]|uniref:Major facilitator superfamily domain-containing protein n=1 Tax=Fusarium redolens TaxID=48865 RepID=A0A9P9HL94_FUSRE|nr:major facilitator superfamily domain-containing protein [Fusarium redolens]KAH7259426.1 major facilitator superfamily domain-containing protein [Fusarium redolens]
MEVVPVESWIDQKDNGSFTCLYRRNWLRSFRNVGSEWLTRSSATCFNHRLAVASANTGIGIFQAYYGTHQLKNYSLSTISWVTSLEGPIMGKLCDSYGPRYVLLGGSLFHVFGGVVSAIGASAVFTPCNAAATWFHLKRGHAFGIKMSGSNTGGIIVPIMINHQTPKVGFGWSMRIASFMILGLLIIANLTVKTRTSPHPQEKPYVLTAGGNFLFTFGLLISINYIITQAIGGGMSTNLANYVVPILNAARGISFSQSGILFGRIIPTIILSDKLGRFNVFILVSFLTAILILALWIPASSNAAITTFAALFGFSSGAFISLGPVLIAQISPIHKIGMRQGLLFGMTSVGALTTSPIGGAIVSSDNGSYWGVKVFAGVILGGLSI